MSTIKTPQPRAGTLQSQRGHPALRPEHFSPEERSRSEWLTTLKAFARWLSFYTPEGRDGDWSSFFPSEQEFQALIEWTDNKTVDESTKTLASRPDLALFLSFLKLLRHPQQQFDQLTARHLSYYYRQVLGLEDDRAEPDQAHLVVELDSDAKPLILPAGTRFEAGADSTDTPRYYRLPAATAINHSSIASLQTLSLTRSSASNDIGFLRTRLIDSSAGVEFPEQGALSFGEQQLTDTERQSSPDVGLLLASPLLSLSEGTRTITLTFPKTFADTPEFRQLSQPFHSYFSFALSTAEGEMALDDNIQATVSSLKTRGVIKLKITLKPLFPALSLPEQAPPRITAPYLRMSVRRNSDNQLQNYEQLRLIGIQQLTLQVDVKGLRHLKIRNDNGQLDPTGPMTLFGTQPRTSTRVQFTHEELATKPLTSLSLTPVWNGKPADMAAWYKEYESFLKDRRGLADDQTWPKHRIRFISPHGQTAEQELFGLNNTLKITLSASGLYPTGLQWPRHSELPLSLTDPRKWPFWYGIQLTGDDFGHSIFAEAMRHTPASTNPPWTPLADSLTLDYSAQKVIKVERAGFDNLHQLVHIHPVGYQAVAEADQSTLLPAMNDAGYLYIGLGTTPPGGSVSLLFQLSPVDTDDSVKNAQVRWSYLSNNRWLPFSVDSQRDDVDRALILSDNTNQLVDSGVIRFSLQSDMTRQQGFPGDNQLWLRASLENASKGPAVWSRLLGVYAQALTAAFDDTSNQPRHLPNHLPAETIAALEERSVPAETFSAISSVLQPYPSFGGRAPEPDALYNSRVSERLRHRNRALTLWDYEHLALARFPELVLARCLRDSQKAYGIRLLVVPRTDNPAITKPRSSRDLEQRILKYLTPMMPPLATLTVASPIFQEVRLTISLIFNPDYDPGEVLNTLNAGLIALLNPWTGEHNSLNTEIPLSHIIRYVSEQPYVQLLMKVDADLAGTNSNNERIWLQVTDGVIRPSSPDHILVPSSRHSIRVLPPGTTVFEGISLMEIEFDFEVAP